MDKEIEYINIMELQVPFSRKELKDKYRILCRLYHPDMHATETEEMQDKYEEYMKKVNAAFEYLDKNFNNLYTNNSSYTNVHNEAKEKYDESLKSEKAYQERKAYKSKIENLCKSLNLSLTQADDLYKKIISKKLFKGTFEEWLNSRLNKLNSEKNSDKYEYILDFYPKLEVSNLFDLDSLLNLYLTESELSKKEIDIYTFLVKIEEVIKKLIIAAKNNANVSSNHTLRNDNSFFISNLKREIDDALYLFYLSDEFNSILETLNNEIELYDLSTFIGANLQTLKQNYEVSSNFNTFKDYLLDISERKKLLNLLNIDMRTATGLHHKYINSLGKNNGLNNFLMELYTICEVESNKREINLPDALFSLLDLLVEKKKEFDYVSEHEKMLGFIEWLKQENLLTQFNCTNYRELLAYIQNNLGNVPLASIFESFINDNDNLKNNKGTSKI